MVPCSSNGSLEAEDTNNATSSNNKSDDLVSSARYPIPQHLGEMLQKSSALDPMKNTRNSVELESIDKALELLMCNSFVAMDTMYFASSPATRKAPWFQHRLILRIQLEKSTGTFSLTDYGCGMTRADLINALGIGAHNPVNENNATAQGIGGFYAAIATLATSFEVGTKSKFDDYYEFKVENDYQNFVITRPSPVVNDVNDIMQQRSDDPSNFGAVQHAESGTRVTLKLKESVLNYMASSTSLHSTFQHIVDNNSCYNFILFQHDINDQIVLKGIQELTKASLDEEQERSKWLEEKGDDSSTEINNDFDEESDPVFQNTKRKELSSQHGSFNSIRERSKYIPLRLSLGERKMLRLVESAMTCCDYTSLVDDCNVSSSSKAMAKRTHSILRQITSILQGLVLSCDSNANVNEDDDEEEDYSSFFRRLFEIARRHKVMNPEKMRTEYGKLVYMLQDAVSPMIQPNVPYCKSGLSLVSPMETVYKFLSERNALDMLDDPLMEVATEEILAGKKTRNQINTEIKRKERAVAMLKQNYKSSQLSANDVHLCLYSICDNNSFLNSNRVPIDKVIAYLQKFFDPSQIEEGYSLSIVSGQDGSRLSHSHERQFYFALQSLTLWRDIIDDMFRLWAMAEEDLLSESVTYSLQDTGQGMQRVQQSPRTYKSMQKILSRVQGKVNQWVGSSVIHLGDHNVPNALSFIDKYTQVPRILGPIVSCLENLERICEEDESIEGFIESGFGCLERLKKDILYDFFKSAFDGSGADNFYDAGSCIDGRLTSAWNWCSQLQNKPFYCIFKLTGFTGFDGEFK